MCWNGTAEVAGVQSETNKLQSIWLGTNRREWDDSHMVHFGFMWSISKRSIVPPQNVSICIPQALVCKCSVLWSADWTSGTWLSPYEETERKMRLWMCHRGTIWIPACSSWGMINHLCVNHHNLSKGYTFFYTMFIFFYINFLFLLVSSLSPILRSISWAPGQMGGVFTHLLSFFKLLRSPQCFHSYHLAGFSYSFYLPCCRLAWG